MKSTASPPTPAPAPSLPAWANVAPDQIKPEVSAILSEIREHAASRLPRLAVLRFNAALAKIELSELVKNPDFEGVPRRAWDDSKPFADILAALTPARLPQSAFEGLKRAEARELAGLLNEHRKNASVCEAVEKYLSACKFRPGWPKTVCERILAALPKAAPAPASDTPPAPASDTPPAPASDTPPAPASEAAPAPAFLSPVECLAAVQALIRSRLAPGKTEILRGMMARAANSPDAWAGWLEMASDAAPANIVKFSTAPAPAKRKVA